MRKILFVLTLAIAGTFILGACTPSSSGGGGSAYNMTATIGPVHMNTSLCYASFTTNILSITGSTLSGGVGGPPIIAMAVPGWNGSAGTFNLTEPAGGTSPNAPFGQYTAGGGTYSKNSSSGTLTVSTVTSTTITGSFSFTCTDGTAITAGTFTAERK